MKLITAQEVSTILNVSLARVYELARTKALPSVHLGSRQLRFDQAQLQQWIESGGCASQGNQANANNGQRL